MSQHKRLQHNAHKSLELFGNTVYSLNCCVMYPTQCAQPTSLFWFWIYIYQPKLSNTVIQKWKKKKIKNRHNKRRKKKQLVNALMKKEKKLLNAYQGPSNKQCKSPQEMLILLNTRQLLTKINRLCFKYYTTIDTNHHTQKEKKKEKKKSLW